MTTPEHLLIARLRELADRHNGLAREGGPSTEFHDAACTAVADAADEIERLRRVVRRADSRRRRSREETARLVAKSERLTVESEALIAENERLRRSSEEQARTEPRAARPDDADPEFNVRTPR